MPGAGSGAVVGGGVVVVLEVVVTTAVLVVDDVGGVVSCVVVGAIDVVVTMVAVVRTVVEASVASDAQDETRSITPIVRTAISRTELSMSSSYTLPASANRWHG